MIIFIIKSNFTSMKKIITLSVILLLICAFGFAQQEKYLQVRMDVNPDDIPAIARLGIAMDAGFYSKKENTFTTALTESEFRKVQELGFSCMVEIDDLESYYVNRNAGTDPEAVKRQALRAPSDYPVPFNFELGSCGGFSTMDECYEHLDNMFYLFPDLITEKQAVSTLTTIEGRPVYYVKISDNPNEAENEPQVLYTGMHHAREPIGMQHLLYYMYYLLENYETNNEVKTLVDNTEMYFIPIVNPDGYQRNITTNPNGGGMWRKNRRVTGGGYVGVDLNRNYGWGWGYDDEGSSPYPSQETYRGSAPFSEPETQIIKEFCESHDFKIALNYHSYSNLLLYAWGYIPELTPDESAFAEYSRRMTVDNNYTYGAGNTTIYPSNGGSDDWMYGEQTTKNKILAYTPEVGSQGDGFWPAVNRIIPLCQENMIQSLLAAKFSGPYGEIDDITPMIIEDKVSWIVFDVKRLGQTSADYTVSIEPLGDEFLTVGDPLTISNLAVLQTKTDSISFELSDKVVNGDTLRYVLTLDNGLYITRDTIEKYYGIPVVVFYDEFPDLNKWNGQWGLYSSFPYSAPYSIADSPAGLYANNANTTFTTVSDIDLTNASVAILNFYARWRIEAGYDYVQLKISTDEGATWEPLSGKYTRSGSSYQATGQPVYDGIQNPWVREEINLSEYAGESVRFRFNLRSDANTTADGFFFDNFGITIIDITTKAGHTPALATNHLSGPWPNPASDIATFTVNIPDYHGNTSLIVVDAQGSIIRQQAVAGSDKEIKLNTSGLASGIYFCKLVQDNQVLGVQKLIR